MSLHEFQNTLSENRHGDTEPATPSTAQESQIDKIHELRANGMQEPITYHYLTFETTLPLASHLSSIRPDGVPAPEPPDLNHHVSPFAWSSSRKHTIMTLSCITSIFVSYAAGSYGAASEQISKQWSVSRTASYLGITTFSAGFAIAPMILAPFSELNGRRPVFIFSGIVFFVSHLVCAITPSFSGLLVARFFVGVGGSTFSSTIGGVISDVYHKEDRNTPMAIFSGLTMFGTGLGPLVSGFVAQNLDWRWVFWVQLIPCGACIIAVMIFFKETRGSLILSRRAILLNKWYEARESYGPAGLGTPLGENGSTRESHRIRWKVKTDEERETIAKMVCISLFRPFYLLCTEPVLFFFSLWAAFSWGVLYLFFSIVPLVFTTNHNFDLQQNGAVFAAMCIGALISTGIAVFQEKLARHYGMLSSTPEGRLYLSCVQTACLPFGLFWFAWTLSPPIHWIAPIMAIGCATMGLYSIYLAVSNYLTDTYHRYASSALAASSFCRNILGGVFPLLADTMFNRMTFSGASALLGGLSLALTIVPWVLAIFGPRIRARSKFAREIMH